MWFGAPAGAASLAGTTVRSGFSGHPRLITLCRVSEPKDPERLLAEALQAQARSAPHPGPPSGGWPRFGLLSGADASSLERERAALEQPAKPSRPQPPRRHAVRDLPAYWVLGLAALLGLATGAVIGLITLL